MNAGGARGNTNRARTRLGSMCILQARNNQAHWGVKKDLCDGCSVVPGENKMSSRSHCQSGAGGKNKAGFIYLFVFFFFFRRLQRAESSAWNSKPRDVLANIGFLLLEERKQLVTQIACV